MANALRKLQLLIWKNFILQIRRPIGTCVEILLPFALLSLLILARKFIDENEECFSAFKPETISQFTPSSHFKPGDDVLKKKADTIAYFPVNNKTTEILKNIANTFQYKLAGKNDSGLPYTSENQVIEVAKELEDKYVCAIIFKNIEENHALPKKVEYVIRFHHSAASRDTWRTKFVYPFFQNPGPRQDIGNYYKFLALQYHIDTAIIQIHTGKNLTAPHNLQQFPYPDYNVDGFINVVQGIMGLIFVLAYMYTAISIVKELVSEKQFRLKESMKMMGLPNWIHWTAWFIKCLLFLLICVICQTLLLKLGDILKYSDTVVVFLFLFIYVIATIFSLFFVSVLFSHAVRAMVFSAVLWFGSFGPYLSFQDNEKFEETSSSIKALSCLFPNSCLGIMIHIISQRESSQIGATISNLHETTSVDDNFTMGQCFLILFVDCFLYAVLTWYIENVFPGTYGIPRPIYFPFQPSYWCGVKHESRINSNDNLREELEGGSNFEREPKDLPVGVSIVDLRKVFKGPTGKKVAVDGLSLKMYKGQITALLGHNGAGKTTTMSILTGLFPPSNGKAYVSGQSIHTDMDSIRDSLGLCPQHNVLFDRLTVKEHLQFFSALKGIDKKKAELEINQMLIDIQLLDKANQNSVTLSGGMKRKLNCAIALIGGSETVFLDEPTSGMDPYARRATWDLLQKYRKNKTIILTTHYMDEADYLGDRIAIMADGQLRCCGTSLFLKKRFGVGYHMTLVKGPEFQENKTCSLIAEQIPTSKLSGNAGAEMSYILEEESTKDFKGLFEILEDNKEDYGITSFGISVTTLEEVFLKVGEGGLGGSDTTETSDNDEEQLHKAEAEIKLDQSELLTGIALWTTQFKAMFIKRFLNSKRERKAIITQIILPLVLILFGLLLSQSSGTQEDDPILKLTLSMLSDQSDELSAIYADFRQNSRPVKDEMLKVSQHYFASEKVQVIDQTINMKKIFSTNNGTIINLSFLSNPISQGIGTDNKGCCLYKYIVLNQQCVNAMPDSVALTELCGKEPEEFGYGQCMDRAFMSDKSINSFDLDDWSTYYQEFILEDSGRNIKNYFNKKVVGFSVQDGKNPFTVWYSNQALHTKPSAFSAGSNLLLKYYMNNTDYGISTYNHPLPRNTREQSNLNIINGGNFVLVMFVIMAACMVAASFVTFLVTEKTSKAKHIQFVSGVNSVSYWCATFCWDFVNYLLPAIGCIILFAAFDLDDYDGELGEVALVTLLFGLSMLPFVYLLSFLFKSALIAYAVLSLLLVVLSLAMVIAVFICRAVDEENAANVMHHIFLLFPTYAYPQALRDIAANVNERKNCMSSVSAQMNCQQRGARYHDSSLEWELPGVGVHCFYMFLESIIYFVFVLLIEENLFLGHLCGSKRNNHFSIREGEDGDVKSERELVDKLSKDDMENLAVVVKDLTKVYRTNGMTAVDHLSVAIPKSECFGLLGVNGAGKTTTFGMLTGELGITDGAAYLLGYNIQTHLRDVQQRIGYCPQFDALVERLTGREMLRMFARLRGIPSHLIEDVVTAAIESLNLSKWADKLCGDYSGGNKRKLSTAMALVGDPPVIFLDEPTSGMDPGSRRFLWNTLTSVLNAGRSIVLTSHSMEECEALCTRLVIMVNGQFKCIGGIQHLKSRFGQGYTVIMKIDPSSEIQDYPKEHGRINPVFHSTSPTPSPSDTVETSLDEIDSPQQAKKKSFKRKDTIQLNYSVIENVNRTKHFIEQNFEGAYLIEERQGLLQYQILNPELRWSKMFGLLEENASDLGIIDYSVSQTSLEQVFLNFAKLQHSEDRVINQSCCSCNLF